ncbi:exosortase H [Gilvimarinus polysaccharolyticus]|uniref:exosortase H n=1 Tax=Gilvimarinus polysaccharolyticus TaxID=863921 RepID=UPI000673B537|nr:exosortase H [Gilvimarinus polysaccharolyticus]
MTSNTLAAPQAEFKIGLFWLKFLVLQGVLFVTELLQPVQQHVIKPFNYMLAQLSASILQIFDSSVYARDAIIWNTHTNFGIEILAGCNAVEASILLASAILAFPTSLSYKLKGLLVGMVALHGVNLLRIISLFYLGQWSETAFEWAHLYVWQALIFADAVIVWLWWMYRSPRNFRVKKA